MGYILPITPFQYMQYNNRVVSYKTAQQDHHPVSALPIIFPAILHAKSQEHPFSLNQQTIPSTKSSHNIINTNKRMFEHFPHITGKGALFDEYV